MMHIANIIKLTIIVSLIILVVRLIYYFHIDIGPKSLKVLIPVTTNALGGLVVVMVTKHSGGLAKIYGLVMGIILTTIMELLINQQYFLPLKLVVAIPLTIASMLIHSNFPWKPT